MPDHHTTIQLHPAYFHDQERPLLRHGNLSASLFRFPSGVAAVRLTNPLGELIVLPYQGQQIWDARFQGRSLTMQSMFDQPLPTTDYLRTYGGFLLHCGATAMGVPGPEDGHLLHGELPNAAYQTAELHVGEDAGGPYLGLSGVFRYTVAFNHNYEAHPLIKLREQSSRFQVSMVIHNLKRSPMELMYLAHANFRPVDNGRLVYTAPCTPQHVRVRSSIPSHIRPPAGYRQFLQSLEREPERHNLLVPGLAFDPEVVFFVDYLADEKGWSHTMQGHPDGSADFISHRPDQLDHGIRWISRTPDQDALGMCLPATAEPEGYAAEKAKGNLKVLGPGASFRIDMEMGYLDAGQADAMEAKIATILDQHTGRAL